MSMITKRCYDLVYRKSMLESMIQKTEEEMKNSVMIMLAKSMDEDVENKLSGNLTMMKKWLEEIEEDIKGIEDKIEEEMVKEWKNKIFDKMDKEYKEDKE